MELEKRFKLKYRAEFSPVEQKNGLMLWFSIPQNLEGQEIINPRANSEPQSSYMDKSNTILYFVDELLSPFTFEVDLEANLSISDAEIDLTLGDTDDLDYEEYVKDEHYLEGSDVLTALTKKITSASQANKDKLFDIFSYVANTFVYEYPVAHRGVAHMDICAPRGDCAEYASLFVTMCRSIGIMARNVTGFVIFENEGSVMEHGWAQVYTKEAGWVDVDAQYASQEGDLTIGKDKYFLRRTEYRLITCVGFNVRLDPEVPVNYDVTYINSLGLEMDRGSVQTLQPIAFSTLGKILFEDSIATK